VTRNQIGGGCGQPIILTFRCPTVFDQDVTTFDVADFAQTSAKRSDEMGIGAEPAEKSDYGHHWLLAVRRRRQ
jgi:hypothetical protein